MATYYIPDTADATIEIAGRIKTLKSQIKESLRQADDLETEAKRHRSNADKLATLVTSYETLFKA